MRQADGIITAAGGCPSRAGGLAVGLVVAAALMLGACQGASDGTDGGGDMSVAAGASSMSVVSASSNTLGPAPLPVYSVGDTYVFDNPRETWTIVEVTQDEISWESDLGGTRQTTLDPLLPSLRSAAPEIGAVTRIITEKEGNLWPLVVGNESRFVVAAGMDQPPYSQSLAWSCRVVGTNLVTVEAGQFNAYKIACARSDGLRLNTYHAPAVGYFVRREVSTAENDGQARSLVAYENGAGDTLVAARAPGVAAMNPLETGARIAPMTAAEVTSLAPMGEPGDATAETAMTTASGVGEPQPLIPPATDAATGSGGAQGALPDVPPPTDTAPAWTVHRAPNAAGAGETAPTPGAPTPAETAAVAPVAPPSSGVVTTTPMPPSTAGGVWTGSGVRLASFRTEAAAQSGWTKFQAAYPALLGSLSPRVERVEIQGRGTFHRLYAGPFASQAGAKGLCGKISEMAQTCDVRTFN